MDGYSSKSSSPSKSTKGPEDDTSRFAIMQRMHRMKTQYQLLQKLQDDFTLSSDEDEKSSESKDEQVPMASPSTAKKASGKRGRKQSLWTNVKSVVAPKAAGSASLMLAVQAAKAAELRNKSKGNSEDGQASADEPNGSKHSPRRKVHHLEGPAMLGEHRAGRHLTHRNIDVSGGDDDDEAGTEGGGDGDGSMLGHSKDANDAPPPVLPPEEEDIQLHEYFKEYEVRCPDDDPLPAFHMPPPPHLMDELHVEAEHEGIVIGKVPKAAIEEQKQTLKARLWEERDRSVRAMKRKEEDLLWREVLAKKRVEEVEKESAERLVREKAKVEESKLQRERQLAREFRRARESLEVSIRNQHAQMGEVFGQLDSHAHETLSRKMYIKSTALPQPVEFRIRFLKAVKTKLPKGAYLLMVTQYESLGGKPLAWTEIGTYGIGEEFPGTTKAVKHAGRYFDRTMKFEDSCYALCPSTSNLKPGFCFVLELFQLQSRTNKEDKPVAWAALPMCNEEMSIVEGKFRLPLLRGQHTPLVQSYKQIERAIASDLDNWLCNIYFDVRKFSLIAKQRTQIKDIVKLNRYINLDFLNKRLSLQNGRAAVKSLSGNENATKNGLAIRNGDGDSVYTSDKPDGKVVQHSVKVVHANSGEIMRVIDGNDAHLDSDGFSDESDSSVDSDLEELHALQKAQENGEDYFNTPEGTDSRADMTVLERGLETETSGVTSALHEEQSGKLVGVESVESAHGRYYASSGLGKRVLRRNQSDGLRLDSEMHDNNDKSNTADSSKNSAELPSPSKNLWHPLDSRRDQELYDMALAGDISKRAHLLPGALAASKWRFIMLEAFGDLMGHKLFSFDFYATCVTLVFSFWLRIYVHYLAQYLYLGFIEVPTYGFEMQPLQIRYKYMSSSMMQAYEIALICIGPAANIVVFLCLMYAGQGMSSLAGNLPDGISTFLSAYGLMVILDPLMVLIVDLIQMNYNCPTSSAACIEDYTQTSCTCFTGDWVKLWDRMEVEGGGSGGITGVLITLIVYFSFAILAGFVYYAYLINIHRNGRILDLWRRIHSLAQEFFVPDDFEISREEMIHICTKAGLWRGGGGDIRRVSVTKLIEKDAEDLEFISVTKLYAIHEMEMDGSNKKLYRQFLSSPDGSIIEVFSDFKVNDKFVPTTEKENQLLLMENRNQDKKAKSNEAPKLTATQRTSKGMFRGLEKA
eukprot:GSChrysophyteH1.ASY1.ANO1.2259.1 assembled CDS